MIIFGGKRGGESKEQKRKGGDKKESKEDERRVGDEGLEPLITSDIDPSKIEKIDGKLSKQIEKIPAAKRLSQVFSKLPFFLGMLGTLATVSSALAENPSNFPIHDTLSEFIKKSIEIPQLISKGPMFIAGLTALTGLGIFIYMVVSRALNRVVRGERELRNTGKWLIALGLVILLGGNILNGFIRIIESILIPHQVAEAMRYDLEVQRSEMVLEIEKDPLLLALERQRKVFSKQAELIIAQTRLEHDLTTLNQQIKLLQLRGQLEEVDILIDLVSKAKQLRALLKTSSVPFKEGITIPSEVAKEQLKTEEERLKIEDIKNLVNDIKNLISEAKLRHKHPTIEKILSKIEADLNTISSQL
jgi:hypothetical protein